jgi:hypothetical protein
VLLRKMIPDALPLLVREPNHSTFISDRQPSAILRQVLAPFEPAMVPFGLTCGLFCTDD